MIGYGIIAVPTGIVTVELSQQARKRESKFRCGSCEMEGHDGDAGYCKWCGARLQGRE